MGGIQFPAAAPPPARSLRRPEWRDTAPLDAVPRCTAVSKSTGRPCQAPALNDESRRRYSEQLSYDVPAGLCAHHVKEHARQFRGIVPTWNFDGWPRCSQRTYKSGRSLPCPNPCMRGLNVCNVHGGRGARAQRRAIRKAWLGETASPTRRRLSESADHQERSCRQRLTVIVCTSDFTAAASASTTSSAADFHRARFFEC
jgi:hypothetical protein